MNSALHLERRFVHHRDLLAQLEDPILPVALSVEPRERCRKRRIVPTPRKPRRVVDQAQRAQRFDEMKLASIEVVEALVAGQNIGELTRHVGASSRKQHPEILDRRSHAAVVEIDEMRSGKRSLRNPQYVAGMTIAVQTQRTHVACSREATAHAVKRHGNDAAISFVEVRRDETVRKQPVARLFAEALDVERRPLAKARLRSYRVDAADEAPEPLACRAILELGGAAATVRIDREAKSRKRRESVPAGERQRRDGRNLAPGKLVNETVFFENLRIGPALWTVELGDVRRTVFHRHLVDAVFVTVEREHPAVAGEPDAVQRVEHDVRRQAGERRDMIVHAMILPSTIGTSIRVSDEARTSPRSAHRKIYVSKRESEQRSIKPGGDVPINTQRGSDPGCAINTTSRPSATAATDRPPQTSPLAADARRRCNDRRSRAANRCRRRATRPVSVRGTSETFPRSSARSPSRRPAPRSAPRRRVFSTAGDQGDPTRNA